MLEKYNLDLEGVKDAVVAQEVLATPPGTVGRGWLTRRENVQDELHLLKEDLGAFDSHYETALLAMQREVPGSRVPWKTVAATATIEEYERHINHLYLLRARRFPTPGPYYDCTFFAETVRQELSRLFVGVNPSGYTHINAMVSLLWYFHREIATLRGLSPEQVLKRTGTVGLLGPEDVAGFLDQYEISLAYVLTKKAGDQMAESLDTQVNTYLKDKGLPELVSEVLSGGTTSDKITDVMARIEKGDLQEPEHSKRIRSVVATSMISHGVDIDRFNFITFFGMPRLTSEYIQASSRIGRALPGIVLVCFAPARERDRSHYHFFAKYHEYLERLVEPAAINRWSKFSIDKTFPGVLIGYLLNNVARRTGRKLTTEKAIQALIPTVLNDALLTERMRSHYGADRQASGDVERAIDVKVRMFTQGLRPNSNSYIGKRRGWKPMRSLRDTDREVRFIPSRSSAGVFEVVPGDRGAPANLRRTARNRVPSVRMRQPRRRNRQPRPNVRIPSRWQRAAKTARRCQPTTRRASPLAAESTPKTLQLRE